MSNSSKQNTPIEGLLPNGSLLAHGKYRIVRHLGSGGFGNTYVAVDTAFDEQVAIKELFIKDKCGRAPGSQEVSITLTENRRTFEQQQRKFRKEAQRLRKLHNPHIVQVHDLFDDNGTSYYVMDFVEGENLSARLKRTAKAESEQMVMQQMLPQLLEALDTVHAEGIWHLDIKPGNILMNAAGQLVLIDFGASKQLRNADGVSQSTSTALACTPGYAPTEQMEGNLEKFGPWTDLYSLGATLYHLLTLRQPPLPSSIQEGPDEALPFPSTVSVQTRDLVKWLMKPVRTMRPQSVAAVRQFLKEAKEQPKHTEESRNTNQRSAQAFDDDEDTELVKKRVNAQTTSNSQPNNPKWNETVATPIKPLRRYALIAVGAVIVLAGVGFGIGNCSDGKVSDAAAFDSIAMDSSAAAMVEIKQVTDLDVTVNEGPKNMRSYKFTGEIVDTIGALPNGAGKAKFPLVDGAQASTYVGNFENGLCHDNTGKASLTFTSGDKYVGTFNHGYYAEGRYTMSDGSYFEGTFKNALPYNGKWYNSDGSFSANVKNGQEL